MAEAASRLSVGCKQRWTDRPDCLFPSRARHCVVAKVRFPSPPFPPTPSQPPKKHIRSQATCTYAQEGGKGGQWHQRGGGEEKRFKSPPKPLPPAPLFRPLLTEFLGATAAAIARQKKRWKYVAEGCLVHFECIGRSEAEAQDRDDKCGFAGKKWR